MKTSRHTVIPCVWVKEERKEEASLMKIQTKYKLNIHICDSALACAIGAVLVQCWCSSCRHRTNNAAANAHSQAWGD